MCDLIDLLKGCKCKNKITQNKLKHNKCNAEKKKPNRNTSKQYFYIYLPISFASEWKWDSSRQILMK